MVAVTPDMKVVEAFSGVTMERKQMVTAVKTLSGNTAENCPSRMVPAASKLDRKMQLPRRKIVANRSKSKPRPGRK